eukprot:TRINITY_DN12732_c0_g1_i3.p1 TRINITY_DN12732_c0_g1~~TRINITY_DN12732_c0_g1_i3.p1  ORF type:complete len:999 (-),score=186.64 TRINITY_DN12732_c0_g1_i3:152-3148(-)
MGEGYSRVYPEATTDNSIKLISAAAKGQPETVAKLLIKCGKKVNTLMDEKGDTALHKAAAMGHIEVIQQLLSKGADVRIKNSDGFTAFHLSVMYGRKRSSKVLLEYNKDIKDVLLSDPFPRNPGIFLDYSVQDRYGVCTWVIRNFTKIEEKKVISQLFQIGGVHWRLIVYPRGSQNDDNLSLYVEVANPEELTPDWSYLTNFSFTVVSQTSPDKKMTREVIGHRFYENHTDLGFLQMVKRNVLYDSKFGFLTQDQLIIEFDMEVIENTIYGLDAMSNSLTWKVQNFTSIRDRVSSFKFEVGGCTWMMSMYPRGKGNRNSCLSLYLKVADSSSLAPGWFYLVNFQFSLVNQATGAKFCRQESKNFRNGVEDWGFPQFVKLNTLFNLETGYLMNETILIELQMEVIDRHRPSSRRGTGDTFFNMTEMRNRFDNMRFTPLHLAAYMSEDSGCKELLEAGAPKNAVDARNRTALDWASMHGDLATTEALLETNADLSIVDLEGYTALHKSILGGNPKVTTLLIAQGADPNAASRPTVPSRNGNPKTTVTAPQVDSEGSNDVGHDNATGIEDSVSVVGLTPLQLAFRFNKYDMCTLLLKMKQIPLNINVQDAHGLCPLHYAAYEGNLEAVRLLLERGAIPSIPDNDGYLPLHKAIWKGRENCVDLLLQQKNSQKLIDYPSKLGYTPLHIAAITNSYSILKILVDVGAKVDVTDGKAETPLHRACINGNIKIISALVEEGRASLNIPNYNGKMAIDCAVRNEDVEVMIYLLEHGAKIPQKDNGLMAFFSRKLEEYERDTHGQTTNYEGSFLPPSTLSNDMRFLVNNKTYTDVVFQVENKPVYALRAILVSRSEFFRVMFGSTLKESTKAEIEITDVKYNAFVQVMEFIYTDEIDTTDMTFDDALLLLSAANRYMLDRLKLICECFITKNIRLSNVSFIFQAADLYGAQHLRSASMHFIANHYQKMVDINDVTQEDCFSEWIIDFFRKYKKTLPTLPILVPPNPQ